MLKIAFASTGRVHVDMHFGGAENLVIFDVAPGRADFAGFSAFAKAEQAGSDSRVGLTGTAKDKVIPKLDFVKECAALILGPRWRRRLTERVAWLHGRAFLELLLPRIESHGTVLCLSPIAPEHGDFCTTARECYMLVNAIDHPAFGLHLSAAGLAANGETGHAPFANVRGRLEHFHADEPGLAAPGSSGQIDHADLRRHLAAISYTGWVSLVQRNRPGSNLFAALENGVNFAANRYLAANLH